MATARNTARQGGPGSLDSLDLTPSKKYAPVELPRSLLALQATVKALDLRSRQSVRKPCTRARETLPLSQLLASPSGPTKYAELVESCGGRYAGEVLAGQPHGHGQYYKPDNRHSTLYQLHYDGQWLQGQKHGLGTLYCDSGEVYCGHFQTGKRHGYGRMEYLNGDVYEGEWLSDRRHGLGRMVSRSGETFVGFYIHGKREGLGTRLSGSKGIEQTSEFVDDEAISALVVDRNLSVAAPDAWAAKQQSDGDSNVCLPPCGLHIPSQILFDQFCRIRNLRQPFRGKKHGLTAAGCRALSCMLLKRLRHAFLQAAAAQLEHPRVDHLPVERVLTLAGLDSDSSDTQQLLASLQSQLRLGKSGCTVLEDYLQAITLFGKPLFEEEQE